MRSKLLPIGLLLAGTSACGFGIVLHTIDDQCSFAFWLCNDQSIIHDLAKMTMPLLLLLVWGMYVGISQYRRTHRAIQSLLVLPRACFPPSIEACTAELALSDRIDVVDWTRAEALCYGLVRPRICITTGLLRMLSPAELEAVLRHERHHLQRRDPLRALLWTVLSSMCWWLEERAEHACLLRELAADRAVIVEQGRQPLASALLKLLTQSRRGSVAAAGLAISGLSVTDARIDQLLKPEESSLPAGRSSRWLVAPVAIVALMLGCSVLMAHL
jgi:hypothetical protein